MELDDMRQLWEAQRQTMEKTAKVQVELLHKLSRQRLNTLFGAIIRWEYANLITCVLLLVSLLLYARRGFDAGLEISYFFALLYLLYGIIAGVCKLRLLHQADEGTGPVLTTVVTVEKLRLGLTRMRIVDIALFPAIVIAIYALVNYMWRGQSIFAHWAHYSPRVILAVLLSVVAAIWLYRGFYLRKLKQASQVLNEAQQWQMGE
jgi:hypothetical protein